jgi:transcriptional regulator with XRE-family HTH domain
MLNIKQEFGAKLCGGFISHGAKTSYHAGMENLDVFDIRRRKLAELLNQRGAAARISAKTGTAASYLSTVKNGDRRLGDELARRIEEAEGLDYGWLDRPDLTADVSANNQNANAPQSEQGSYYIQASSPEELAVKLAEKGNEEIARIIQLLLTHKDKFDGR